MTITARLIPEKPAPHRPAVSLHVRATRGVAHMKRGQCLVMTGQRFGSWVVLEAMPRKSLCQCDCGTERLVENGNLRREPGSRSCTKCAMLRVNVGKRVGDTELPIPLYRRLWTMAGNATTRCTVPGSPAWKDYGGRGIKVWGPWLEDKGKFIDYLSSLSGCENPDLVLDRIDNDGDYSPGNLRFTTRGISTFNRRKDYYQSLSRTERGTFRSASG
jgi:hypothetical protein